ncbi:class I SAM-dependent methyltransferase [Ascidiimonas sp. W6]|uniref:class I SAM-dependent methyltransferase n=1 Tax=Ascidiimonas meishanensis TaxID=3128903 RepID=UPI0030EF4F19
MKPIENYKEINKASWNNKVPIHVASTFYDFPGFLNGKSSLNSIELNLLGDIQGKSILHLQCHFGLDSLSLSRLGAHVTGVDLSDKAIEKAKELSQEIKSNTSFICCDLYDLPKYLDQQFDLVFTSYGTIGWLPNINKWSQLIAHFLKPNGKFVFVEFHPVVWMFDDYFKEIKYNYFNKKAIVEKEEGTYAEKNAPIQQDYISWNHSLSDVINNLIKNNIEITSFEEFDYSPYDCFKETEKIEPGKFRIKHLKSKIPMVYSIVGIKKDG